MRVGPARGRARGGIVPLRPRHRTRLLHASRHPCRRHGAGGSGPFAVLHTGGVARTRRPVRPRSPRHHHHLAGGPAGGPPRRRRSGSHRDREKASMSQKNDRTLRILVAKPGLDGHDRGAKIVARALRDAGFEVIYTGLHQTPEMIAAAAVQEDVDGVGLSIMSGAHLTLFPAVIDALRERGAADVSVFGGGIIPQDDIPRLKESGVSQVFLPGTTTQSIVDWIRGNVKPRAEVA